MRVEESDGSTGGNSTGGCTLLNCGILSKESLAGLKRVCLKLCGREQINLLYLKLLVLVGACIDTYGIGLLGRISVCLCSFGKLHHLSLGHKLSGGIAHLAVNRYTKTKSAAGGRGEGVDLLVERFNRGALITHIIYFILGKACLTKSGYESIL